MSRALRVEFPGATYHVVGRGNERRNVFRDDADRRRYLRNLGEQVDAALLEVLAFCLMSNHVHLLVRTPRGGLARVMRDLHGDYAAWFNRRHERVGHLWQGRYRAILVDDGEYLAECARYIHLNPTRAKLVGRPHQYRWSSHRNYVGGDAVVPWVDTAPVLRAVGGGRAAFRRYVETGRGEPPVDPFERAVAGFVLGGQVLVARVQRLIASWRDTGTRPSLRRLKADARPPRSWRLPSTRCSVVRRQPAAGVFASTPFVATPGSARARSRGGASARPPRSPRRFGRSTNAPGATAR